MANADAGGHSGPVPVYLGGGRGAAVWSLETPAGPRAIKVADAARLAGEATVLAALAGIGVAPRLVASGSGILITERVAGAPRSASAWSVRDAAAIGRLLRRVHDQAPPAAGGAREVRLPSAPAAPVSADLVRAVRRLVPPPDGPAVLLHGDPWSGNLVWADDGPLLVDWEFARTGEPAEDLAYLAAMDRLASAAFDALLSGYGADAVTVARVRAWRPFMAAWCADWYARSGDADRSARLAAHAAQLLEAAAS